MNYKYIYENHTWPDNFVLTEQNPNIIDIKSTCGKKLVYPTNNTHFCVRKQEYNSECKYSIHISLANGDGYDDRVSLEINKFLVNIDNYFGSIDFKKMANLTDFKYQPCVRIRETFDGDRHLNLSPYSVLALDENIKIKIFDKKIDINDFYENNRISDKAIFLIKIDYLYKTKNNNIYGIGLKIVEILHGYRDTHRDTIFKNGNCIYRKKYSNCFEIDLELIRTQDEWDEIERELKSELDII